MYLLNRSGEALSDVLVEWLEAFDSGDPWGRFDPRPRCILSVRRLSSKRLPMPFPGKQEKIKIKQWKLIVIFKIHLIIAQFDIGKTSLYHLPYQQYDSIFFISVNLWDFLLPDYWLITCELNKKIRIEQFLFRCLLKEMTRVSSINRIVLFCKIKIESTSAPATRSQCHKT